MCHASGLSDKIDLCLPPGLLFSLTVRKFSLPLFSLSACCASSPFAASLDVFACHSFLHLSTLGFLPSFLPSAGRFHFASRSSFDLSRLMLSIDSPLPSIRITPAPPEKDNPEPQSPIPPAKLDVEDDGYRAKWLSLPPLADTSLRHSSPLRPASCPPRHKGLSRDQFNSLLAVSRDQRANLGTQKKPDLRKELALKSQALKQRTYFLVAL